MAQDRNNVAGGSALAAVGIPDVHATALDPSLRYVDLNRQINHDYGILGQLFQAIIDPGFRTTGASEAYPAWFVFAAFASRAIGQAQLGAEVGLDAARFYQESGDHRAAVARSLPGPLVEHAALLVDALLYEDARLAATFLVGFASAGVRKSFPIFGVPIRNRRF